MNRIGAWMMALMMMPMAGMGQQSVQAAPQTAAQPLNRRPAYAPGPIQGEGRIHLDVVVADKPGKPVSGLAMQDFALKDNGMPTKILSFHAIDPTVQKGTTEVTLLLDAVNLGFQEVARSRDQIANYLRQNGGQLAQPVSVLLFTDQGLKVLLQPSTDGNALARQLEKEDTGLRTLNRSAQFGGIERFELSMKWMTSLAGSEAKRPGRKLLIWVGPGWPLLDRATIQTTPKEAEQLFTTIVDLSTTLREAHLSLYSVSLGESHLGTYLYQDYLKGVKIAEKANAADLSLKVLATQTGGRVVGPDNDITAQIDACVQDAGAFYTVSFDPPPADRPNEYHDLKIEIDKPGLTARTSSGYYNQP
jgi:VWFA-related protein